MAKRRPIADGYLDELFDGADDGVDATGNGASATAVKRAPARRKKTTSPAARKRKRRVTTSTVQTETAGGPTVTIGEEESGFLETLAAAVERNGGRAVKRNDIARVLINGIANADIDFSTVDSLAALARALRERLHPPSLLELPQVAASASLRFFGPLADGVLDLVRKRESGD